MSRRKHNGAGSSLADFYRGRRVLVIDHARFEGAWLCEWLLELGAEVYGFGPSPDTTPALFQQLRLDRRMACESGSLKTSGTAAAIIGNWRPAAVFVLGGDPAFACDLAAAAEHHSCPVVRLEAGPDAEGPVAAQSGTAPETPLVFARAGCPIGGGDWRVNRLFPDCIRNLIAGRPLPIRDLEAVLPWQHILEPLAGCLLLARAVHPEQPGALPLERRPEAIDFGPDMAGLRPVASVVDEILLQWNGTWESAAACPNRPTDERPFSLDNGPAKSLLGWRPRWNLDAAITETLFWYRNAQQLGTEELIAMTRDQIRRYMRVMSRSILAPHLRRRNVSAGTAETVS